MKLSELKVPKGAVKKRKIRGRGAGSGHGKTSCRGHKGAKSRSGPGTHMGFEGGQMPLIRRLPKRGFTSKFKILYEVVNIEKLNTFKNDSVVNVDALIENKIVRKRNVPVKILGEGKLTKSFTVKADAFSASAKKKIIEAGGKVEIVSSIR
jgi:large subunit ribosomal protein L15